MPKKWFARSRNSVSPGLVRPICLGLAALVLAISWAAVPAVSSEADQEADGGPRRHRVEMRRLQYQPSSLTVAPGDTVVWVNLDFVPHTVTAKDESWDSPSLGSDEEWEVQVTAEMTGDYFCAFHPSMTGRLRVKAD